MKVSSFRQQSHLSRLGSGSAARSIYGHFVEWGLQHQEYATPLKDIHPIFHKLRDAILIISGEEKPVSSRIGHSLMENHPFRDQRVKNAIDRTQSLLEILKNGQVDGLIEVVEAEAFELHAMMMSSAPPYLLIRPSTVRAIEIIQEFRRRTKIPICFTS